MAVRAFAAFLVALIVAAASPARAFEPASTGVVVIHGKWGRPGGLGSGPFAAALRSAGFIVDEPEMPWSGQRLYDRSYDAAMDEVDAAVAQLRAAGAKKIVIAGHSLGGSAALHYATQGRPIDAVVLIAPAPLPEGAFYRRQLADAVTRARQMVAAGHGDDAAEFTDLNSDNRSRVMRVKAAIYLSYNAADGPASMTGNAAHLGRVPLLWIAPRFDPLTPVIDRLIWPKIQAETSATRIEVIADHMQSPITGREAVIDWLKHLN
jgi:pimeloyl-ACP methyl ester carboxylesterase